MLQEDRFIRIQAVLSTLERVTTEQLIKDLQVSRETVRQDLVMLESLGLVRRVHGGVASVTGKESPIVVRKRRHVAEKRAIAKSAAKLLKPGQLVFIDSGSTTEILAEELALIPDLLIVTNSFAVALKLAGTQNNISHREGSRVILLGGDVNPEIQCTFGEATLNEARRYRADVALLSPVGVCPEAGVSFFDEHEARLATAMIEQSAALHVLADYSKIGRQSRFKVCDTPEIDYLVTNPQQLSAEQVQTFGVQGVKLV